jgi:uncharacterized protein YgiM (DUF1202 family)
MSKKRLILSVVILALLVFTALAEVGVFERAVARQPQSLTAFVAVEHLAVHQAPAPVAGTIAQFYEGQSIDLTGYQSADGAWVQVTLPGIEEGWVPAAAIEVLETETPVAELLVLDEGATGNRQSIGAVATIKMDAVAVRESLGQVRHIVARLEQGERVELAGFRTADGEWVQIQLSDGQMGWVGADTLQSDYPLSALRIAN